MNGRGEMAGQTRQGTRRTAGVGLLVALPAVAVLVLCGPAAAAPGPGDASAAASSTPLPILPSASSPAPSKTPSTSNPVPSTSVVPVTSTHRAAPSTSHRYHSSTPYRAPSTRSASSDYSISESATGGPTQTFVLGSASLGTVSSSTPVVTASPTSGASTDDSTDRYVQVFFAVIVGAALLLAAGIAGLVLTRDGRYSGGRHR